MRDDDYSEPLRLLPKREVLLRLGISNSQFYRGMRAGTYPPADISPGTKSQRWSNRTILAVQKRLLAS